jgi:predicted nucleotidyltransferase
MTDELTETLREIVARLELQGIAYMLVGSVAALAYGRDRSTKDFDVVLEAGPSALRALVRSLPEERFYVSEEAAMEALRHESQFNVIDMVTGWKVDLIPRKHRPFSETEFARRSRLDVMGVPMYVASVEDVIVAKLEWAKAGGGSERQLEDVHELVRLGDARLDRSYVDQWVQRLGLSEMWGRALGA